MELYKNTFFDLSKLRNVCLDNDELVVKLLSLFLTQSTEWKNKLQAAVDAEDCEAIRFVTHTIKGGSATLYADSVIDAAVKLNEFAHGNECSGGKMRQLADNICKTLSDTKIEVEKHLNSLSS